MIQIGNYPPGANILPLDIIYSKPRKDRDTGKWVGDNLYIVYRDLDTGEKKLEIKNKPESHIYFTKEELKFQHRTQRQFIPLEDVEQVYCKYSSITKVIKERIESYNMDSEYVTLFNNSYNSGNAGAKKELHKWRNVYYSDYDICDYYLTQWLKQYEPKSMDLRHCVLDIETDIYRASANEKLECARPISEIALIFNHDQAGNMLKEPIVIQMLLRNYDRYKGQKELEDNLEDYKEEAKAKFRDRFGEIKLLVKFYDDDLDLMRDTFNILHSMKSDFVSTWNMSFDVPYMIGRLNYLGEDPADFFCHPDFGEKYMYFYVDNHYKHNAANRSDYFDCACYSRWICQMSTYAQKRKGKADYGGVRLDNVGYIEVGEGKAEFDKPSTDVVNAAIREYRNFALYGIKDVLIPWMIENTTDDILSIYDQAYNGGTRFAKAMKQTVYIKNVFAIEYFKLGLVPENNTNINYVDRDDKSHNEEPDVDDISLAGALVGAPELNFANGLVINGKPSDRVFENCIDMDAPAMYPNQKIKFQLAKHCQYFRVIMDEQILHNENPTNSDKFLRGGKFIEDLITQDNAKIGRWFKLKSFHYYIKKFRDEVI